MKKIINKYSYSIILVISVLLTSCNQNYTPLPRGFLRIDLPEHKYSLSDTTFPYYFEYAQEAELQHSQYNPNQKYWINIVYPKFKAKIYLSYKSIHNNLIQYLEDSYTLVSKHIPKADAINDSVIINKAKHVYGLTYKIEGNGAASPFQFFVTDSTSHFLRGALYFDIVPNNDSLEPVINFITKDIDHLINTLQWNNKATDK